MRLNSWKSLLATTGVILAIGLLLSAMAQPPHMQAVQAPVHELVLNLDPSQTKVHWNVDSTLHMVHGTFDLKSGSIHFDPATGHADGSIVVNAVSGQSGNSSRDQRMHKEILETSKFPDAIFRPTSIEGKVATSGPSDFKLHGVFSVHGAEHDLIATVHTEPSGDTWKGTARFDVPYIAWGIKDPSNFLLKVKPVVNVELELVGTSKASN